MRGKDGGKNTPNQLRKVRHVFRFIFKVFLFLEMTSNESFGWVWSIAVFL